MGDERAETYLRLRAEAELRRTGELLRGLDAGDGPDGLADPGRSPFAVAERAAWRVVMAGRILVAAGALGEERLACVTADFHAAVRARSRLMLDWDRRRHMLYRGRYSRAGPPPSSRSAGGPMRVTPVGQAVEVAGGRAPATLHLMSLVRTGTEALVTVVMRMRWPPDGSSTDLEISGAGPHHLPFGQLWAADEEGTRYAVRFEAGQGGTDTWAGVAQLTPVPPDRARWLEVYGDGTRLARLPLRPPAASGRQAPPPAAGPAAVSPAERLLAVEAEHILASGGASGAVAFHRSSATLAISSREAPLGRASLWRDL